MKRSDKRHHNPGRPSKGLSEVAFMLRMSQGLLDKARALAKERGISTAELFRDAAQQMLDESPPPDEASKVRNRLSC